MILTAALLTVQARAVRAQEHFTLAGADAAVYNIAGNVRVVSGSGNAVTVDVTRAGADAAKLRVASDVIDGVNTLRVIYPADDVVYPRLERGSESTFSVRPDGTFGGDGRRVRVTSRSRAHGGALEAYADIVVRVPAGMRATTHLGVGDAQVTDVVGNVALSNASGRITARGVRGETRLSTASGSVEANDMEGMTEIKTASGSVRVDGVRGSGLRVDVASGEVTAENVQADNVELQTASGGVRVHTLTATNLRLETASGEIKALDVSAPQAVMHTASGSIDAELHGVVRNLSVNSASGSVELRLPSSLDAQIDVESASGSIDLDFPVHITHQERSRLHGVIGNGSGRIVIGTSSGSVTLRQ